MAYVDRFIFRFNSLSGKAVRIAIADNDYTGTAVERRLGGSPQLRCELSGNIHGMSLEIPAECEVDDEFAVLYTSDPTRFAVRLEVDSVVVWRGFVTPELYAAPWIDPPYDVQITATDGLGELKMLEWPAIGSRTLGEILETTLGATGLALPVRMISTAVNDLATAADLLTGTTVNLDHMAGKSYYDVLDGLLGSLHCTILQRGGAWLLVRETDVTSLTSGGQVSDTSGNKYPVKPFGSSSTHDCWPVGRLTTEIVPAKSTVEVECPNHLESLISDPDMELNLWQTNGSWTDEDGGYYTLDLGEYISQTSSVANATRDADPGFRIKVSSRHTTPFDVGIMRLTVMATGRDPRSGSDTTLYLKEVTTRGRTQMEWVTEESHFDDGLGMPKTLDHQDCKEFVTDIFRLPTGFNPIKTITIRVSSGRNTVCVHSVNIECMSVYDRAVTRLLMDNGARGDESYSPLFADSFVGNKGNFLLSNSLRGVAGAMVRTWSSDAIPSVPYGEWLSKDMALSVATPRLRMSGRLFTVTSLPALFYSNKGLSYITEEWSLDLIEDEADISLISLPAAALSTVSVSVIVEDKDGRQGTVSGGEIVSPKTGEAVSPSGTLDWFIAEAYEEDGEIKYRLKLNPKYQGMYAEGWVSSGGISDTSGGGGASYLHELLDVNLPSQIGDGQALIWDANLQKWTSGDVTIDTTPFERVANKVTSVSAASDNTQYPTAKAVYDIVNTMLSSAMRFQGVTTTALVDGSTTNPVVIDGESYTATIGDVVVRSDVGLEYLWTGAKWQQLGDETSYAKKTVTITGSGYLTGGGNLEAARTIDIADEIKAKIDNGATAYANLGNYLPLDGGTMTGSIHMPTGSSTTSGPMLHFRHESGGSQVFDAYVGANNSGTLAIYAANDLRLRPGNSSSHGLIITTTDITYNGTSLINSYLPLTGGTMTGTIHRSMIGDTSSYQEVANWVNTSGNNLAAIGYWNIPQAVFINPNGSTDVWSDEVGKYSLKISPSLSGLTFNTHTIWHAGNDGTGSGLDADVLDGKHANQFVPNDEFALIPHFALADIPIRKTAFGGIGWDQYQSYPYAGGGYLTFYMGSSLQSLLVLFPSYSLSEPPILYSSVDGAAWGDAHQLAYTTSNVSSATKLRPVGTSSFDLNTALQGGGIIYNYISISWWQNAPNGIMYGCVAEFSENDDSDLAMQLAWDVNHDSTQSTKDLWFRSRNNLGWQNDWKQIATTASNVASATKLQTPRNIWGQAFDGTSDIYGSIMNVLSIEFSGVPDAFGHGGFLDFHFNGSSDDYTSRIIEDASGRLNANNALYAMYNGNVGIGTPTPAYKLDIAGDVRTTGAMNIKIPYSSSQNTYANYFKFINSENTDVAHINVTGQGHLGLYANRTIEFMADGTRRFIIGATSTQVSEKKAGFYPEIDGTITLNSAGALSALGNGYNVGKSDKFIRATYSKIIYLTDSVYIYYDTVNNCIRTNAPIVSDSYISAGGVSTT